LLQSGKQTAEANEGLGVLAMRADPVMRGRALEKAQPYMEAARKAGTHNFVALTEYASLQDDPDRAIEILKEALGVDPKYAQAHWVFGEKLSDPARRMAEWKQAVNLAPRNYDWWDRYARLCLDRKQYAEAGRAWMSAAQAAPDAQLREQYLTARGQIEQQRLDAEDAERRKDAEAKAREIDRLKNEARKELAALEARVNTRPLSAQDAANTVDYDDAFASANLTGSLVRVECTGKQLRLSVKNDEGRTLFLFVPNTQQFEIKGAESLTCGVQKPRRVTVSYKPASKTQKQDPKAPAGEATGMEFQR
jgi:tetratricopeptide (TPR) repeat protein